jgi:hypothetical protein
LTQTKPKSPITQIKQLDREYYLFISSVCSSVLLAKDRNCNQI